MKNTSKKTITKPSIAVIVLNWNNAKDTKECLESLKGSTVPIHVVLVDNNSKEPLTDLPKLPHFSFIKNSENLGYAGGNNTGILFALKNGFKFISILNNDTIVDPDFYAGSIESLNQKGLDAVAGRVRNSDGTIYSWGGTVNRLLGRAFHGKEQITSVTFLPGCAFVAKKDVFESIGGFDERYFLYYEDTDWSLRALERGFALGRINQGLVHKTAQTVGLYSDTYLYHMTRNQFYFIRDRIGFPQKFVAILSWFFLSILGYLCLALIKRPSGTKAVLRGVRDALFNNKLASRPPFYGFDTKDLTGSDWPR